jgi:hypothetical protein
VYLVIPEYIHAEEVLKRSVQFSLIHCDDVLLHRIQDPTFSAPNFEALSGSHKII